MNYDANSAMTPKIQISYGKIAKSVILGTIISLFSAIISLVVFAVIVNAAFGDPDSVLHIFTVIGASLGAFAGGFRASRFNGANGLITGLLTGVATSIVLFMIMLFAAEPVSVSVETDAAFRLVMILCVVLFACIGGIVGNNRRTGSRIRKSKRRK